MSNEALIEEINEMIAHKKAISLVDKDFLKDVKGTITRLLAVEVAAKEICKAAYWKICNCEGCTDKRTGLASIAHKAACPVLVINPIGDNK